MDIICHSCKAKLTIPDHKVPKGKKASFFCPKCKNRIQISPIEELQDEELVDSKLYHSSEKPFDFVDDARKTSLLCMKNSGLRDSVSKALGSMGHIVTLAEDVSHALTSMKYHLFDVVMVDDQFDLPGKPGVLDYFCSLEMVSRRRIFVVLVAKGFRTMDRMIAFSKSVNLVINEEDLHEVHKILARGIKEHELFYSVFNASLKETGKA